MIGWWHSTDRCVSHHLPDWSLSKGVRMPDRSSRELIVAQVHKTCHSKLGRRFHSSSSSFPKMKYIICGLTHRSLGFINVCPRQLGSGEASWKCERQRLKVLLLCASKSFLGLWRFIELVFKLSYDTKAKRQFIRTQEAVI